MNEELFKRLAVLFNDMYDKFNQRVTRMEEYMTTLADKTYDRTDAVYKEVLDMRTEQAAHTGSHMRVDETLKGHDKRIKKLESPAAAAHTIRK